MMNLEIREWRSENQLHRGDGLPAIEYSIGPKYWWVNGKRHRDGDLPAIDNNVTGKQEWWVNGKRHRDGGLPAVVGTFGLREWWVAGKLHRDGDQPAVVSYWHQIWVVNGKRHRDGGMPAVERSYQTASIGRQEWWFEGHQISQAQSKWIANIQAREDTRRKWFILQQMARFRCDPSRAFVRRRLERELRDFHEQLCN